MFLTVPPSPTLAGYIHGYWFVEDLEGLLEGQMGYTAPYPGAVLTINFAQPTKMIGGALVPRVSLLGLQTQHRHYQASTETYFVLVMLSFAGLTRLFPRLGHSCIDQLVDAETILGSGPARNLWFDLSAAWSPSAIARQLDMWLLRRLECIELPSELAAMKQAYILLRLGRSVQETADELDVSRRQLARWFVQHFGVAPKQLMDIVRLQSSLRAVQTGIGDPIAGFSDQAHQVRNWQRRLGLTPGRYSKARPSELAQSFNSRISEHPAYYL